MGAAGNSKRRRPPCLTTTNPKAPRKARATLRTRSATARGREATGPESAASGRTPMEKVSTSSSKWYRWTAGSRFASRPRKKSKRSQPGAGAQSARPQSERNRTMTHFPVGIIVPPDKLPHLQNFIFEQMQPYDEAAEVEPYVSYSVEQARAEIDREDQQLERIIKRRDAAYN